MKNCLTVAVLKNSNTFPDELLFEGVDVIKIAEKERADSFFTRLKKTQSKYLLFTDGKFTLLQFFDLLKHLEKSNADVVSFKGGKCFKSQLLKAAQFCGLEKTCADISMVFVAKTTAEFKEVPLVYPQPAGAFDEADATCVLATIEAYSKIKSKLGKEIYNISFNLLCDRTAQLCVSAILAVRSGAIKGERLGELINAITAHKVLHLAVEKRLDIKGGLAGIVESGYKISGLVYKKLLSYK